MSRKLISDLFRLLRVIYVTCFIFPISARNVEETFASFFVVIRFVLKFHRNWFVLKNAFVFFQMFCIQYFI